MSKQRIPIGIVLFGSMFILTSLNQMMVLRKLFLDYEVFRILLDNLSYSEELIKIRYCFSWFLRIVGLVIGIGLLLRKEVSRKAAVFLGCFTILTLYWKHPYEGFVNIMNYLNQNYGYLISQSFISQTLDQTFVGVRAGLDFSSITWYVFIVMLVGDITWSLLCITYFTHPKIKEYFQERNH